MESKKMDVLIITGHEATLMHYENEETTKTHYTGPKEIQRALDLLGAELNAQGTHEKPRERGSL